jgi:Glycosyl transferase family 2
VEAARLAAEHGWLGKPPPTPRRSAHEAGGIGPGFAPPARARSASAQVYGTGVAVSIKPRVTVVVPCYRCKAYLPEAIESALSQDYEAVEIVAVDDGSPDDVASLLEPYGERVRLLRHDRNRGTAIARNTAIDASDAPFLAFLDADDRWLKTKVSIQVEFMIRNRGRIGRIAMPRIVGSSSALGAAGHAGLTRPRGPSARAGVSRWG